MFDKKEEEQEHAKPVVAVASSVVARGGGVVPLLYYSVEGAKERRIRPSRAMFASSWEVIESSKTQVVVVILLRGTMGCWM